MLRKLRLRQKKSLPSSYFLIKKRVFPYVDLQIGTFREGDLIRTMVGNVAGFATAFSTSYFSDLFLVFLPNYGDKKGKRKINTRGD